MILYPSDLHSFVNELNNTDIITEEFLNNCSEWHSLAWQIPHSVLEHRNFSNIDISLRSVATCLNCGGKFNNDFITNLLASLSVKEF